jgi:uncharacterized membrane protein
VLPGPVYLHLALNHVPVVGSLFALALLVAAIARRSGELGRASLATLVVIGLAAIPTFLTGDPAHEIVEEIPGVSRRAIHEHEQAGQFALIASEVVGALGLFGLVRYRGARPLPRALLVAALVLTLWLCAVMARTANLGAAIRHPEMHGAPVVGGEEHEGRSSPSS